MPPWELLQKHGGGDFLMDALGDGDRSSDGLAPCDVILSCGLDTRAGITLDWAIQTPQGDSGRYGDLRSPYTNRRR